MGKGALKADKSSYERNCATHGAPLGGDAYINTINNLGGDPENPFQIFPEVAELYAARREELKAIVAERYAAKTEWAKAHPELAAKMEFWFSNQAPKINWEAIEQKGWCCNTCCFGYRFGSIGYSGRKYDSSFG